MLRGAPFFFLVAPHVPQNEPSLDELLTQILDEFSRSDAQLLHVRRGAFEFLLSKDRDGPSLLSSFEANTPQPVQPAAAVQPSAPAPRTSIAELGDAEIVKAPNLGAFYRAPKPGAKNYVEIGDRIEAGDEICLIEVMKLFTAVRAQTAGRVSAVLADDGAMVTAGQPLFAIARD